MKKTIVLLAIVVLAFLAIGCTQSSNPYSNYNAPTGGAVAPVVGGGCGVSGQADYESTPSVDEQESF